MRSARHAQVPEQHRRLPVSLGGRVTSRPAGGMRGSVKQPRTRGANSADPILQLVPEYRRDRLVAAEGDGATLRFDIHLQGPQETVFFDL